jgi:site-specific DNA-methyltransferase (adenine-specific)
MIDLRLGDCQDLIRDIPDKSIDLIFTDPPYPKEYLYLYEWLATVGSKKVKDTGFIAMYVGCYHLWDVMRLIGNNLDYFMELVIVGNGFGSMMWQRRVIGKHKSVLLFRPKGGIGMPRCNITSVFVGTGADKRYHAWGQDEASARYYIDCLKRKGDLVLDPFCGGGTTPAMCKVLERDCIAFEIDPATEGVARSRVGNQQMPLASEILSNASLEAS